MIDIKAIRAAAEAANKHDELSLDQLVEYLNAVPTEAVLALCDEIERLKDLLGKANALCRIRADEIERLQLDAEKHRLRVALTQAEIEHGVSK